ncbi:MAG: tetratricopeptide repeat protein [Pontiellaceae bacterium]|nr:tetratricopeptide repeat protein [Pontiellaceae bacterium]
MFRFSSIFSVCLVISFMLSGCVWLSDLPYRERRQEAERAFDNQEYIVAAARYEALQDQYPETPVRQDIIFRQGVALYSASAYHEARITFLDYLDRYPHGQYIADVEDYVRKIDLLMSKATPAAAKKLADVGARADLDELFTLLAEHPTDSRVLEAIGDTQWKLGNYDEAIESYYKANQIASTREERSLSNSKLILDADGNPIPLTPGVLEQMDVKRRPLRVYGLHTYTSRSQSGDSGGDIQFYNLTGSVRNQGNELLRGVEVEVVYKDVAANVLDVDYVKIGTLGPGEVKTFLSRADSYDNLYNIVGYDVEVHWER